MTGDNKGEQYYRVTKLFVATRGNRLLEKTAVGEKLLVQVVDSLFLSTA